MKDNLFRKTSLDKATAPEELDGYIKVVSPGMIAIVVSVLVLLTSLFVWAIIGSVYSTVETSASVLNGEIICYVSPDDAAKIAQGMPVSVNDVSTQVTGVSQNTLTPQEVAAELGDDYLADAVIAGEWNVRIDIAPADVADGLASVVITTEQISPINFLINS